MGIKDANSNRIFRVDRSRVANDLDGDNRLTGEGDIKNVVFKTFERIVNARKGTSEYQALEDLGQKGFTSVNNLTDNLSSAEDRARIEKFAEDGVLAFDDLYRILDSFSAKENPVLERLVKDIISATKTKSKARISKYSNNESIFKKIDEANTSFDNFVLGAYGNNKFEVGEKGTLGPEYLLFQDKVRAGDYSTLEVSGRAQASAHNGNKFTEYTIKVKPQGKEEPILITINSEESTIVFKDTEDNELYTIYSNAGDVQKELEKAAAATGIPVEDMNLSIKDENNFYQARKARRRRRSGKRLGKITEIATGIVSAVSFGAGEVVLGAAAVVAGSNLRPSSTGFGGRGYHNWTSLSFSVKGEDGRQVNVSGIFRDGTSSPDNSGLSLNVVAQGASSGQVIGAITNKTESFDEFNLNENPSIADLGEALTEEELAAEAEETFNTVRERAKTAFKNQDTLAIANILSELENSSHEKANELQVFILERVSGTTKRLSKAIDKLEDRLSQSPSKDLEEKLRNAQKALNKFEELETESKKTYSFEARSSVRLGTISSNIKDLDAQIKELEAEKKANTRAYSLDKDPALLERNSTIDSTINYLRKEANSYIEFAEALRAKPELLNDSEKSHLLDSLLASYTNNVIELASLKNISSSDNRIEEAETEKNKAALAIKGLLNGGSSKEINAIARRDNAALQEIFNNSTNFVKNQLEARVKELESEDTTSNEQERETAYILINLLEDFEKRSNDLELVLSLENIDKKKEGRLLELLRRRNRFKDQIVENIAANSLEGREKAQSLTEGLSKVEGEIDRVLKDSKINLLPDESKISASKFLNNTKARKITRTRTRREVEEAERKAAAEAVSPEEQIAQIGDALTQTNIVNKFGDILSNKVQKLELIVNIFAQNGVDVDRNHPSVNSLMILLNGLARGDARNEVLGNRIISQIQGEINKLI